MRIGDWLTLRSEAKAEDRDNEPTVLAPAEAFPERRGSAALRARCGIRTEPRETGPESAAVARRIASSCAGWVTPPTGAEFFAAVHARNPTTRQAQLISMWLFEATNDEIMLAWAEEAYSFRDLVNAIHQAGAAADHPERNRELNRLAET